MKKKMLFVCLGNICRSPSAEAVMNGYLSKNKMDDRIECDSAGIGGWHVGESADNRMSSHAAKRDYELTSIARKFDPKKDFDEFDLIVGMDQQNVKDLESMARNGKDLKKIKPMADFCVKFTHYDSIPDPYYGGGEGFELVLDLLEDACMGLLNHINGNESGQDL